MKVVAATLALLVSHPGLLVLDRAAAEECQTCSSADICIQTYFKAVSQAQRDTAFGPRTSERLNAARYSSSRDPCACAASRLGAGSFRLHCEQARDLTSNSASKVDPSTHHSSV